MREFENEEEKKNRFLFSQANINESVFSSFFVHSFPFYRGPCERSSIRDSNEGGGFGGTNRFMSASVYSIICLMLLVIMVLTEKARVALMRIKNFPNDRLNFFFFCIG